MEERALDTQELLDEEKEFGFARVYSVELKFKERPRLDRKLLYANMERYTGKLEQPGRQESEAKLAVWEANEEAGKDLLHFFHLNYNVITRKGTCLPKPV
ncbi:hypothetical protein [Paenibacillus doosanensis]|uniref:hypothetical protein n=1 Tax=Paenibacillus doosanensis TaxID=1229154 RepID=UPI00287B7B29|nr:hypothetical protein [Paenibacillus doosanensis]